MPVVEERFYELAILGEDVPERPILRTFVSEVEPEIWRLYKGEPMASLWPDDARIYLTGDEGGLDLCQMISTTQNSIIAHQKFKELIAKHCPEGSTEYLPVAIYDHRKRILSDEYFVVHPVGVHDCIDLEKSRVLWDDGPGSRVLRVTNLVIDRDRGSKAPQLFRPEHARSTYLLRFALAKDIAAARLSNVVWTRLGVSG